MCSMCWTAEEDKGDDEAELAATHILSYGQNTMGIGYMALWGFGAKCRTGLDEAEWSGYPLDCYYYQSTFSAKVLKK